MEEFSGYKVNSVRQEEYGVFRLPDQDDFMSVPK
jgi:hypothetical protein